MKSIFSMFIIRVRINISGFSIRKNETFKFLFGAWGGGGGILIGQLIKIISTKIEKDMRPFMLFFSRKGLAYNSYKGNSFKRQNF